ncbi:hypothetical protein HJA82_29500 [Rhizobium bangladeshense]|uniref:hypothetical protein n=1 Tax=Rhizobium bangladeshense TaxID=1138189 RepID=UPI001C8339AD|nr:hypothetical protein [Rhizobium bangladeshense]MBX4911452.1 hypothetical protein [Rhizobium bangladeshense]
MAEITNKDRATWAADALAAFKASHQCDTDEVTNIKDLITDLLHLARREHGVTKSDDLYHLTRSAADMHFAEAIEDPEE